MGRGAAHRRGRGGGPGLAVVVVLALVAGACSPAPPGGPSTASTSTTAAAPLNPGTPGTRAGGNGTPPPTTNPAPASPTLAWRACGDPFQCSTLRVPLDYAHPSAGTVDLALIRLPASDPAHRVGSLLVNPGGPGASGIDLVRSNSDLFSNQLRARFDLVGFDPRGVGMSDPVRCESGPQLDKFIDADPAPTTPAGLQSLVTISRSFAANCAATSGTALLAHVGTVDAARDMDRIRAALGEAKLTYLGFSYGTFLGATYADLFPTHIRAMALDGAIDPSLPTEPSDLQQALGFEQDLNDFLANCDATAGCPLDQAGGSRATFDRALARIHSGPPIPTDQADRPLGSGDGYLGIIAGLYSSDTWPILAQAVADVLSGNAQSLLDLTDSYTMRQPDGTYANTTEANAAINCVDRSSPTQLSVYQADAVRFAQQAPDFGALEAYGPLVCAYWPVPPTDQPHRITAKGAPAIVVVGTTGDPATPYAGAQALASQLASGVLITHNGVGHTAYGDSTCVSQAVDAYLVNLAVPRAGLVCTS